MRVGSLFAGIGGFDLGLERAGMTVAWQCEINPFAQHTLNKHWPDVPCYDDITALRGEEVEPVDILCGGFPCQDISNAGKRAGIEGERSSLWGEVARLVGELRPSYLIVENVAALRRRGLDRVLGDLAALGYDAEWDGLRASDFGAPHRRDRIWIVAYPGGERREGGLCLSGDGRGAAERSEAGNLACDSREPSLGSVADAHALGCERGARIFGAAGWRESADRRAGLADPWAAEPDVGRVAHGVPARVDRLTGLGNALVPQIAEWIGRRILDHESALTA